MNSALRIKSVTMREVLGTFCTGIGLITSYDGIRPYGFACQSISSVSLDPPYISLCPAKTSTSWPNIRSAMHIGINILASDQQQVCERFAQSGGDKFDGLYWRVANNGSPIIEGAISNIECTLEVEHDAGDHTIAICRITDLSMLRPETSPLLFYRGGYNALEAE